MSWFGLRSAVLAAAALIGLAAPARAAETHCVDPGRPGRVLRHDRRGDRRRGRRRHRQGRRADRDGPGRSRPRRSRSKARARGRRCWPAASRSATRRRSRGAAAPATRPRGQRDARRVSGTRSCATGGPARPRSTARLAVRGAAGEDGPPARRGRGGAGGLRRRPLARNVTVLGERRCRRRGLPGRDRCAARQHRVGHVRLRPLDGDVTVDHAITDGPDPRLDADGRPAADSPAIDAGRRRSPERRPVRQRVARGPRRRAAGDRRRRRRRRGPRPRRVRVRAGAGGTGGRQPAGRPGRRGTAARGRSAAGSRSSATGSRPFPSAATGAALGAGPRSSPAARRGRRRRPSASTSQVSRRRSTTGPRRPGSAGADRRLPRRSRCRAPSRPRSSIPPVALGHRRADRPVAGRARERGHAAPARAHRRRPAADAVDRGRLACPARQRAATTTPLSTTSRSRSTHRARRRPRRPGPTLKPFSGVVVLTARPRIDRFGRIVTRMGCADATVGHCSGVVTVTRGAAGGGSASSA